MDVTGFKPISEPCCWVLNRLRKEVDKRGNDDVSIWDIERHRLCTSGASPISAQQTVNTIFTAFEILSELAQQVGT